MNPKERDEYGKLVGKLSRELHSSAYLGGDKDAEARVKGLRDQLSVLEGKAETPREQIRARVNEPTPATPAKPAPVPAKS